MKKITRFLFYLICILSIISIIGCTHLPDNDTNSTGNNQNEESGLENSENENNGANNNGTNDEDTELPEIENEKNNENNNNEDSEPTNKETETVNPDNNSDKEQVNNKATYIRCKVDGLNIRSGPSTNYKSLGYINKNDMVVYRGQDSESGWYKTYYCGKEAYVSGKADYTELVEMTKGSETIERVIELGTRYLGTEYVYGATRLHNGKGTLLSGFSTNAFDCSSLMQYIYYYGADVLLDVTTRTQYVQGDEVDVDSMKRGDLMYFTNETRYNNKGIERVGHVALYLGDNYILHTASDYAVIEPISKTRWSYLLSVRRHIDY